jgi:hypothetical protein
VILKHCYSYWCHILPELGPFIGVFNPTLYANPEAHTNITFGDNQGRGQRLLGSLRGGILY